MFMSKSKPITLGAAILYGGLIVGATRFLPMLSREPVMWGMIYGAAVFIVMNFVVLPHTAVVQSPLSLPFLLNGVLGHAFFVGLPIALAARLITAVQLQYSGGLTMEEVA